MHTKMFSYVSFSFSNKTGQEGKNGSISRFLESYITFRPLLTSTSTNLHKLDFKQNRTLERTYSAEDLNSN